jgi:hypothetical protein
MQQVVQEFQQKIIAGLQGEDYIKNWMENALCIFLSEVSHQRVVSECVSYITATMVVVYLYLSPWMGTFYHNDNM